MDEDESYGRMSIFVGRKDRNPWGRALVTSSSNSNKTEETAGHFAEDDGPEEEEKEDVVVDVSVPSKLEESKIMLAEMIDTCQDMLSQAKPEDTSEIDKMLLQQGYLGASFFDKHIFPTANVVERNTRKWNNSMKMSVGPRIISHSSSSVEKPIGTRMLRTNAELLAENPVLEPAITENVATATLHHSMKHTSLVTNLLKNRSETIGINDFGITVDKFIDGMKRLAAKYTGPGQDVKSTFRKLNNCVWPKVPNISVFVGAFDHKDFLEKEKKRIEAANERGVDGKHNDGDNLFKTPQLPVADYTKQTIRRSRNIFNQSSLVPSQEHVNKNQNDTNDEGPSTSTVKTDVKKSLVDFQKSKNVKSVDLMDFCISTNSVHESLNNIFSVAFAVRDGNIGLSVVGSPEEQYQIQPQEPDPAVYLDKQKQEKTREQCIISLSANQIRKMMSGKVREEEEETAKSNG